MERGCAFKTGERGGEHPLTLVSMGMVGVGGGKRGVLIKTKKRRDKKNRSEKEKNRRAGWSFHSPGGQRGENLTLLSKKERGGENSSPVESLWAVHSSRGGKRRCGGKRR